MAEQPTRVPDRPVRPVRAEQTDVFISYSRKDKEFVQKLNAALIAQNRTTWVDWNDIAISADWRAEIAAGIDNTNAFLFILSPDSAKSDNCREEIELALKSHKRLLAISHRKVGSHEAHSAIAAINWLPFGPDDDFNDGLARLIATLDTDLDYVKMHTRLWVRAQEWENRGRNKSYLLRGTNMQDAEKWVAEARNKSPALADLQDAYIRESRIATNARQRVTIGGLTTGIVIALFLAALAFIFARIAQANEATAVAAKNEAEANLVHSESLRLAAEASAIMNADEGNPETGALLSIRAINTEFTPQAQAALERAATLHFADNIFVGHTDWVTDVAFSHDGKLLATGGKDGTIRLWDAQTAKQLKQFSLDPILFMRDYVSSIAFSPDDRYLATGSFEGPVILWDVQRGEKIKQFGAYSKSIRSVVFSADGAGLLSAGDDNLIHLWDVARGREARTLAGHTKPVLSVFLMPDQRTILSGSSDGTARLWDGLTGQELHRIEPNLGEITTVSASPDGKLLLISGSESGTRVQIYDAQTYQVEGSLPSAFHAVFSPDGKRILAIDQNTMVAELWDTAHIDAARPTLTFGGHLGSITNAVFSADSRQIATSSWDGTARTWDIEAASHPYGRFVGHTRSVATAAYSPDSRLVLTGGADSTARLWDAQTGKQIRQYSGHAGVIWAVAFSPDGKWVATGGEDKTARLWDAQTGKEVWRLVGHTALVGAVAFSPDGKLVVTGSDDRTIRLWSVESGILVKQLSHTSGEVTSLSYAPNGQQILYSGAGIVEMIDAQTGASIRRYDTKQPLNVVNAAAISPDGAYVATASGDNPVFNDHQTLRLFDAKTGEQIRSFTGHSGHVFSVAFSPDSKLLLSGAADNTARLWDVQMGLEIRRFSGHSDWVRGVAYAPDGKSVFTASLDRTGQLWIIDYHDEIKALCSRLKRDLSDQELKEHGLTPGATCPVAYPDSLQAPPIGK